jgi:hypothetical protein
MHGTTKYPLMSEETRKLEKTFLTPNLCSRDAITPMELLNIATPFFGNVSRDDKSHMILFHYKFISPKYSIIITICVSNNSSQYVHLIPYERFSFPFYCPLAKVYFWRHSKTRSQY